MAKKNFDGYKPPEWLLKKKSNTIVTRMPKDFMDVVDVRAKVEGFRSPKDYLRQLAKNLRPSADELRKRGLIREDNETQEKF